MARAAPSVGSVPAPSSSNRQRERRPPGSKSARVGHVGGECGEALLNALLVPISANTSSNTASSDPSKAGMWRPACPMRVKSPTVFRDTVLPPVLGPVTTKRSKSLPSRC